MFDDLLNVEQLKMLGGLNGVGMGDARMRMRRRGRRNGKTFSEGHDYQGGMRLHK